MKAIKRKLGRCGRAILGDFITEKLLAIFNYICYEKNPIVQIMYLILAIGGFAIYVVVGFWKYIPGPYVNEYHKTVGTILMLFCYYSFFIACSSDPGIISKSTHKRALKRYDYDNVMYVKQNEC
jgi:palmitoyltransferase